MSLTLSDAARTHLRWALTPGVGPITFGRLLERFGDAEAALRASAAELQSIERVGRELADRIARGRVEVDIDAEIAACAEHGVRIVCRADADYPAGLRQIPDPPIVLYVRGELRPTDALALAVVGSRRCTIYGSEQARRFGELLAGAGFTVVSGLARGIDAFAQHGAVEAGGRSIAVLGSGLDEIYPPENRALADKLLERGAWISELPIRTAVRSENFPSRNRIIAGMSLGTLVVEAAVRSGALITARLSGDDYNREVFAVPGRVGDPTAAGTNALIREGKAKLVTDLQDILTELGDVGAILKRYVQPGDFDRGLAAGIDRLPTASRQPSLFTDGVPADDAAVAVELTTGLSPVERQVFDLLGRETLAADAILGRLDAAPGDVLAVFTSLELKGLIRRLPGQRFVRTLRG